MNERLSSALAALKYDATAKPTVRITLLFGIQAHARMVGDEEIAEACETEIQAARAAMRTPAPPAPPGGPDATPTP